jgi:hypothetical protein
MTSRNATGKPRSWLAHQTAPKAIAAKPASLSRTRTGLSVKIPCRRRLNTPSRDESTNRPVAIAAMR